MAENLRAISTSRLLRREELAFLIACLSVIFKAIKYGLINDEIKSTSNTLMERSCFFVFLQFF
jgi:hypothetical protein